MTQREGQAKYSLNGKGMQLYGGDEPVDYNSSAIAHEGYKGYSVNGPSIRVRDMNESPLYYPKNGYGGDGKLQSPKQQNAAFDYRSEISGGADSYYPSNQNRQDSFYNKAPLYKRIGAETPKSDLESYMSWAPQQEKHKLSSIQKPLKVHVNKLSPLRAGPSIIEDDRRSNMSRTVLQVRDKFNRSKVDDELREISIDGISISGRKPKARDLSNLRTIDNYGLKSPGGIIELNSNFQKKNKTPSIHSPAPRRRIMDEFSWEDQQKLMSFSINKLNKLKREDLLNVVTLPNAGLNTPQYRKPAEESATQIDEALKKIARAGDDFVSMKDYARALIKRFDSNNDGVITFQELCDGVKQFDIDLQLKDRIALMRKLDMDRDGEITDVELTRALSTVERSMMIEAVDKTLRKIATGAEDYPNMRAYVKVLIKKFDSNNDGLITFQELCDGLKKMSIYLSQRQKQALMSKIDLNLDGEISEVELVKVLNSTGSTVLTNKQVEQSIEQVLKRLAKGADNFNSMKDYTKYLIRRFDGNSDGIITFQELCDGLVSLNIIISNQEKKALMKKLDLDQDGKITENELYRVISSVDVPRQSQATYQIIEQTLKKIANGAEDITNMKEYSKALIKKFDRNSDGIISFKELCDGLKKLNIYLTPAEREALMLKLDINRDGSISDQEIYKALSSIDTKQLIQMAKETAEIALKKLAAGAEDYPGMKEYVQALIRKFDYDNDGLITFNELCNGIKQLNIFLTLKERQALMRTLDLDQDGTITGQELFKVLSRVDVKFSKNQLVEQIDHALRKIASGADDYSSMKEYVRVLMHSFDQNADGFISFEELVDGLKEFKINLTSQEKQALMKRLDFNRDGEISEEEIQKVLSVYDNVSTLKKRSTSIGPDKVSLIQKEKERISVDDIITKIKRATGKYQSLKHYVSAMMRRYDTDNDGYLNFQELSDGLSHDNVKLTKDERLALMKHLDVDCDGMVSREEIFQALLLDSRHRRNHHFTRVNIDNLLKRIKQGAEKFKSLEEFCRFIFVKMDTDGSGTLSFHELSAGLIELGIDITQQEKHELMKKLDDDADGEIGFGEFYRGLATVNKFSQPDDLNTSQLVNIDHALIKIARGAEQYKCIEDYLIFLYKKFGINREGALSFKELREGLVSLNVHLSDNEIHALFHKIDSDRDGYITMEELYNAILTKEKYTKNPNIGQQKVNVDHVLNIIKKGVERYSSLDEYVNVLMKKFDINGDGSISIDELSQGLKSIDVKISEKEKLALMKELDKDRDGGISQQELYNALADGKYSETSPMNKSYRSSQYSGKINPSLERILAKVRKAVEHYMSKQEQLIGLMRIFDLDNDGLISYLELVDGVKSLGIIAKQSDMIELMSRIDTNKDGFITQGEFYTALDLKPAHSGYQGSSVTINDVLIKLKRGSEKYHNLHEYVNYLYEQFAVSSTEFMSFQELINCLKTFSFNLQHIEKIALMKHMDENGDNQISKEEFYNALAGSKREIPKVRNVNESQNATPVVDSDELRVDHALLKIKSGAARFKSLQDYCLFIMKKFDTNKDGYITFLELVDGLREIGIKVFKGEQSAMMRRLDDDRDGVISYDELYKALVAVRG